MDTKNFSKFQKIQLWLSVIPFWSTIFIVFVTMGVIKKHKPRSAVEWGKFMLTFFGGFIVAYLFSNYVLTGQNTVLNIVVEGLILFVANLLFVVSDIEKIKGKRIVLIDDVYTTGATLKECAKILLSAGAKSVDALTVARVCQ